MPANSATAPGNQQPPVPPPPAVDPCTEANEEAQRIADENKPLPKKDRPNKISVLRSKDGKMVAGRNRGGNIPLVEARARAQPPNDFNCRCAELNCISNALAAGVDVKGAVIVTIHARGENTVPPSKHGTKDPACSVCEKVLEEFEVIEC